MKPIRTPGTNRTFKLEGGTEENDLPLEATVDDDDGAILRSTWELSDEERQVLAAGGYIELCVWGIGTPPVSLSVVPFV